MRVVITGGGGFIGKRLAQALLKRGELADSSGQRQTISRLVLCDIVAPEPALADDPRLDVKIGDFTRSDVLQEVITADTVAVFHLAAVVSGGAEADFDLGMSVNLHGSMALLEVCRQLPAPPKVIFASSVAVYGGEMPEVIQDDTHLTPQTSYGVQKAAVELLMHDYSRKGFIDGRALRLPTIVVRPGKPNKAASSFASSILREPLQGQSVVCPVSPQTNIWLLSPRCVVDSLIHSAELPAQAWGEFRGLALPGITVSVQTMVDTLALVAGQNVVDRIRWEPDPVIENIVYGWATRFNPQRGLAMGFKTDRSMTEIIEAFIEDDLNGEFVH